MSLRLRLLLSIGISMLVLWTAASVWLFVDLRGEFRATLDERLAASARMVAGLVSQLPEDRASSEPGDKQGLKLTIRQDVACEIRLLRGDLVARTGDGPVGLGEERTGYSTRTIQGEKWRTYTLQESGMRITTADRVERRQALLRDILLAAALPFLIAAAGSLLALWYGVRRGLAPLESIRKALARRQPGMQHPLPQARVPAELVPLVATMNALLERMEGAIERERSFTGNAAHELRTPLTAVKTHIQVARMQCHGDDATASLAQAEEGAMRLQHTLDQLLTLARVEGPFHFDTRQDTDARAAIRNAVQHLAQEDRERIRIDPEVASARLAVPSILVATALRNLLDNALRYSPANAVVLVSTTRTGNGLCFDVSDAGGGMSETERSHALQRFWRKGNGYGSGLGLSIVSAIAERYGGSFELHARPVGGTSARLTLPLAPQA
ncbi:ATP-binding protein [Noviherbaspirillum pedocola]|uniref:histidine kinase n=1 Tax=Noviherbaspirillum pedocola TaxID=2801341 RepID=A0A934SYE0_9BURK|nr:ATP-binding protein [Noviherbaspirillum pedocola]MBK4734969.1 sensor histidine kinase N-terminal domain-containing protein [Noviherbaspirillum pedocola]